MARKDALNPRKIPRQARAEATVDAILEAAARILERKGREAYTTNAVAELAGVSIGSLYQYFPSKDAITRALIERQNSALLADLALIDPAEAKRNALQRLIAVAVDHQLQRSALARLLDIEELRLPAQKDHAARGEKVFRIVETCIAASGFAPANVGKETTADVLAIVKGMVDAAGARGEHDRDALARRIERAVFGYLGGP